MYWEPTDDGRTRCLRHPDQKPWAAREHACVGCESDPGPELGDDLEKLAEAPEGCLDSTQHERRLTELGQLAEEMTRLLATGIRADGKKGRINYATVFDGLETALKLYRAAQALTATRERRVRIANLERRQAAMNRQKKRGGGHN